ncbi:hypothetical protein NDU88_005479 [Pleurodeles waltl]|uniref:4Fe-4S ferredoxin-type domain-containing protein n=1 Tax=Pleurodeles waltl TaxID=8319 RepID=A0AAV7TB63_PLEWA|nr:hypothetical protein NDU88_005479 [Pleurodeles waltl]
MFVTRTPDERFLPRILLLCRESARHVGTQQPEACKGACAGEAARQCVKLCPWALLRHDGDEVLSGVAALAESRAQGELSQYLPAYFTPSCSLHAPPAQCLKLALFLWL